ncbi:aldo/keto reductase [Leifsonia sp. AG29]|uniref:aldo/keto reductase n=1 Tax=Leifsonia sp. AG29 TaxID=2598860 RepID=UPI00131AD73D
MRTTTLGADGPEVGVIGLGAMGMSFAYDMASERDEATSIAVIHEALDLGMTLIDTADVYGPFTNEELVGRALADRRDRAVLATKVGLEAVDPTGGPGGSPVTRKNGRPEHVRAAIDESLRRLRTDRLDLWQLHRVDPDVPIEETWGAMAEAVRAGKVRHLGLSEIDLTVELIRRAQAVHPVAAVQGEFSLWTRDLQADVLPYLQSEGIALIPFSPLGRGFLTGRFSSFDELPRNDQRRRLPRFQEENLAVNLRIAQTVRELADRIGVTPAQLALAWILAQGEHIVPIPGTKTPKYLRDNAGAAGVRLDAADLGVLNDLPAPVGARY